MGYCTGQQPRVGRRTWGLWIIPVFFLFAGLRKVHANIRAHGMQGLGCWAGAVSCQGPVLSEQAPQDFAATHVCVSQISEALGPDP
jgi:hypothetical protein